MSSIAIRDALDVKSPAESVDYINMLIYGEPGAGKTWLCGSAQMGELTKPVLFVDVEGGVTTVRHWGDIDVVQVRTLEQLNDVHAALDRDMDDYYKTVIIDSLTELQKLDMSNIMLQRYLDKPEKIDRDVPDMYAWGKSANRLRLMIRKFRDLEMHVICTCLLASEKEDSTAKWFYYPSLPGKLRAELPGFFDIVGYLRSIEEQGESADEAVITRIIQFAKTEKVVAKDRTASLGDVMRNPTLPEIWETINKSNPNGKQGANQ